MKYIVKTLASKTTSTNKPYFSATLEEVGGPTHEKVSIWSDFPNFANIAINSQVEGTVETNDKGYKNLKAPYNPNSTSKTLGSGMMKEKAKAIEQAQDRKETAIELSSTFRDATLILTTFYKDRNLNAQQIKDTWLDIRKFLMDNFGNANGADNKTSAGTPIPTFDLKNAEMDFNAL